MIDDSITIEWTGVAGQPRRIRFEPRGADRYRRIEQRQTTDEWVTVGQEIVSQVNLRAPAAIIDDSSAVLGD